MASVGHDLLAGRQDFAIAHIGRSSCSACNARRVDALHAESAFFHHAARTHRHIRVAHQLNRRRLLIRILQEVEAPHLVRAVVRAVLGADAAVVNLLVDAFGLCVVASTGQTGSHGAFSQCWHIIGWKYVVGILERTP